jgi:hypothetical protein
VTESLTLKILTSLTGLGSGTGRICPIVTGSFAVGKSATSASTGNSTGRKGHIVAEGLTVNLITYSTVLGLGTGSLYESMRKSFALSLSAKSTHLSYSTGSLCPNVLTNLFRRKLVRIFVIAENALNKITGSECE